MNSTQTLEKALTILELFVRSDTELGTKNISESLDMPAPTVNRFLNTLYKQGYLNKSLNSKRYSLSSKWLSFANRILSGMDFVTFAIPILSDLRYDVRESVYLDIIEDNQRLCVFSLTGLNALSANVYVGQKSPLWVSASARILLTSLSETELKKYLDQADIKPYAENSITDKDKLIEEIQACRNSGITVSKNEYHSERTSIAAPIINYESRIIGSAAIAMPSSVADVTTIKKHSEKVAEAAIKISESMGYIYPKNFKPVLHVPKYLIFK